MSKLFTAVIAATVLFLANAPAQAQELSGFYVGGGLGAVVAGNTRTDGVFTDTGSVLDGQHAFVSKENYSFRQQIPPSTKDCSTGLISIRQAMWIQLFQVLRGTFCTTSYPSAT